MKWTIGAGMAGCLYDWGPETSRTLKAALESAEWYLQGCELKQATIDRILRSLKRERIHYFDRRLRPYIGADYLEITSR